MGYKSKPPLRVCPYTVENSGEFRPFQRERNQQIGSSRVPDETYVDVRRVEDVFRVRCDRELMTWTCDVSFEF